jgi:hypothetical protein
VQFVPSRSVSPRFGVLCLLVLSAAQLGCRNESRAPAVGEVGASAPERVPEAREPVPPPRPVDCGRIAAWDREGDGLSDTIEENNARAGYAALDPEDCDRDPSRVEGEPYRGRIASALNLSDRGAGYRHFRGGDPVDGDDWGSLALVDCLERVGRSFEASGRRVNVNDLSRRAGGRFPPHRSHQNGLDVDVRYVRQDGADAPLDLRFDPDEFDASATQQLFRLFVEHCPVRVILADVDRLGFGTAELGVPPGTLLFAPGHSNHFHVRLKPPRSGGAG